MDLAPDDHELMRRILAQDHAAFRLLAERHALGVLRVARAVLHDEAEAEDVTQETLLRLWRSRDDIVVGEAGLAAWLKRVARNLAIDRQRRAVRLDVVDEVPERADPAGQEREIEDNERKAVVDEAMAELPDRQRQALLLFHHEGFSVAEIATELDVSQDAAESLLARGRRGLKTRLASQWRDLIESGADLT